MPIGMEYLCGVLYAVLNISYFQVSVHWFKTHAQSLTKQLRMDNHIDDY